MGSAKDHRRPEAPMMLTYLNLRRFELLLHAAQIGRTFTVKQLRKIVPDRLVQSLPRDVITLETHGLLWGDPPLSQVSRQGYEVTYTLPDYVPELFAELADEIRRVWPKHTSQTEL